METVHGTAIPVGKDVFGALPRILAAVGSGVAAVVIIGGALVSAWRFARNPSIPDHGRLAGANAPDRAGHARALERRAGAGRGRSRRGVRAQPRRRHLDRLLRLRARQRDGEVTRSGKISRRVIFNSRDFGPPSILGARASPGGSSTASGPWVWVAWRSVRRVPRSLPARPKPARIHGRLSHSPTAPRAPRGAWSALRGPGPARRQGPRRRTNWAIAAPRMRSEEDDDHDRRAPPHAGAS